MQILGNALAIGNVVQGQLMANRDIEDSSDANRLIGLGNDAAVHSRTAIDAHYIIKRFAIAGSIQQ